jgi:tetratricopeptide (TPR) repeat protein
MKHGLVCYWFACILATLSACYGQNAKRPGTPKAKAQPLTEDQLRIRLQINPHDEAAHQTLIDLLHKRYSFRGVVLEDAVWIKNNPGAYLVLDELDSYATAALHDPEFAIAQETMFLSHAVREQDDFQYDVTKARLAGELTKRGRPEAALPLVDELIKLNPQDASLWADRAPPLLRLGRTKEAIESLRNTLNGDPSSEGTHEALADALLTSGDLSAAESEYRAAISVYNAKYKKGDISSSLDSLTKKLIEIEQKNHEEHSLGRMRLKLARILKMQEKWNDAVAEIKKALEVDKNGLGALYFQAQVYDAAANSSESAKSRQLASDAILKLVTDSHFDSSKEKIDPRLIFLRESLFDSDLKSHLSHQR